MKKTYITPAFFAVELGIRKNFMLSVSNGEGEIILTNGGNGDGTDMGVKEVTDVKVWDKEW